MLSRRRAAAALRSRSLQLFLLVIVIAIANFTAFGKSRPFNIALLVYLVVAVATLIVRSRRPARRS